ncbi:MAG: LemA family protein, partial [Alphaproteobacteria bacterium]
MYYIILLIIAFIAVFCLMSYNRMVKAYHQLKEGFSGVDVQLKRRADLVPALYDLADLQLSHDIRLLTELSSLQKQSIDLQGENSDNRQKMEKQLHQKTQELFAI